MELDDHLIIIIVIELIDKHEIINKTLIFIKLKQKINGNVIHMVNEIKIFNIGEIIYNRKFDFKFKFNSFLISLIASAIGCKTPIIETLFGPFRFWI